MPIEEWIEIMKEFSRFKDCEVSEVWACDRCGWTLWPDKQLEVPCWRCMGTVKLFPVGAYKAWFKSEYVDTMELGEFAKKLGI